MNITDYLIEKSNGLLIKSPEDTDIRYSKFNTGGIECETGELLYGFVQTLKPEKILETGTHLGISASYMGMGLKENGRGKIITIEYFNHLHQQAMELFYRLDLGAYIDPKYMNIDDFNPEIDKKYDMIFLDSEPERRFKELVKFFPYLKSGGYVFIHDLPPTFCQGNVNPDHPEFKDWPFGPVPEEMKNWIKDDKLQPFSFPTPRGLVGFYRTKEDDYRA